MNLFATNGSLGHLRFKKISITEYSNESTQNDTRALTGGFDIQQD